MDRSPSGRCRLPLAKLRSLRSILAIESVRGGIAFRPLGSTCLRDLDVSVYRTWQPAVTNPVLRLPEGVLGHTLHRRCFEHARGWPFRGNHQHAGEDDGTADDHAVRQGLAQNQPRED